MSLTSSSLMQSLKNPADERAWARLCQVYQPLLQYWVARLHVQAADRDDLVQNVLLVVCQKFPEFQHNGRPGAFRTWLRTIVAFQGREFLNKRRAVGCGGEDSDALLKALADPSSEWSQLWDREHDQFVIRQMLGQIERDFTPGVWRAFYLLTLEELSPRKFPSEQGPRCRPFMPARRASWPDCARNCGIGLSCSSSFSRRISSLTIISFWWTGLALVAASSENPAAGLRVRACCSLPLPFLPCC